MISPSHLKAHGVTGKEYKEKFPGSILRIQSEESKNKIASSKQDSIPWNKGVKTGPNQKLSESKLGKPNPKLRGQKRTAEQREKISKATKMGMIGVMTTDVREKISQSHAKRKEAGLYVAPMHDKEHSAESKERIKNSLKSTNQKKSAEIIQKFVAQAHDQNISTLSVENNYWFNFSCNTCGTKFARTRQIFRDSTTHGEKICPTCHPRAYTKSKGELEMFEFISSLQADAQLGDRQVLGGKEIDIYIPSLKIGFEFTGLYWHSEKMNGEKNHLLWKQQMAHNHGVRLFTIYEDEWENQQSIVKSRIKTILGLQSSRVYARSCDVREIDSKVRNQFLAENHIQGKDSASLALGLFFKNELVALASFKKSNMVKGGKGAEWELSRFCNSLNTRVIGGASKLITHFMREFNSENLPLISYADRRWSDGALYKAIGFEFVKATPPSYWYLTGRGRVHRSSFMKHKLVKSEEDINLTEWELAQREGLNRIWDCGTTKWIMKKGA
jgi:hypothetical protein